MENKSDKNLKKLPQPLGFYHVISEGDALHYGFWPDEQDLSLLQAQKEHSRLLLSRFPEPPCHVLDVGCGLGLMAGELHAAGYLVTAIAPSDSLISYAAMHHPGPDYFSCGFLDVNEALQDDGYDVVLFQESLQYFPQLDLVFQKAAALLKNNGRIILCDEVSYDDSTRQRSAVHTAKYIECSFFEQGFFIQKHYSIGAQVLKTCEKVLEGFAQKKSEMLEMFGQQIDAEIGCLINEWHNLQDWYSRNLFGYEVWDIRPSPFQIRAYQEYDESIILEQFNSAFQIERSQEHWHWKFKENPQGGPYIAMAWNEGHLAAHYAAYPLSICVSGRQRPVFHVGDTFTAHDYRGIGRGKTNLLSRVVRYFRKAWCEGQIDFFYGFNTGKIQKLGKMCLNYEPIAPVYEHVFRTKLAPKQHQKWSRLLRGVRIELTEHCETWADSFFDKAKNDYSMLITRDSAYLKWRYEQHPDFNYQYVVIRHLGRVVGWWVIRPVGRKLLLVDALILKAYVKPAVKAILEVFANIPEYDTMTGWFSKTPNWFVAELLRNGFLQQRQFQGLDLCATFFNQRYAPAYLTESFYYTMGDSDLY